jgi:molybdopterin molybdotransferase
MLTSLVRQFGGIPRDLGIVRDDEAELNAKLVEALHDPVVITIGGMSMGTHDLAPRVLAGLGVTWKFHGVRIRPGKPVAYGRGPEGQHVFGLPGNPVSAFVCAWLFVRMAIRGLLGHPPLPPHRWRATLNQALSPGRDSRPAFIPARVWNDDALGMMAEACAWGGSDDPFGPALANALLYRSDPTSPMPAGSATEVIIVTSEL